MTPEDSAALMDRETEIGFCSKCHIIRQDDKFGPVTPCECFVDHHAADCHLRIAIRSPIAFACDAHDKDSCPSCFPCTCGVAADRMFVCGRLVFSWEPEAGLVPLRREPSGPVTEPAP
jgi:hypothetical protein